MGLSRHPTAPIHRKEFNVTKRPDREIIYVGDPMCAWCHGFAPVLDALVEQFHGTVPFHMVMGGLRVTDPIAVTEAIKSKLIENWNGVTRTTGQAINGHLLAGASEFLYDSAPSSRAFVTVRRLDPQCALPYYKALHHAFYMEMKNITDGTILKDLAQGVGIVPEDFTRLVDTEEIRKETEQDFALAVAYNAQSFPAIVLREGETTAILSQGFKPLDALEKHIKRWVDGDLTTDQVTPALLIFG